MFNSRNLQIAMLNFGIDAEIEWQWDGGHVPSEVLGDSFSLSGNCAIQGGAALVILRNCLKFLFLFKLQRICYNYNIETN